MRFPAKLQRLLFHRPEDPALRAVRVAQAVCLVMLLGALCYLIFAEHPWEMGIGERLAAGKNLTIDQDMALGFTGASMLTIIVALILHQTARWWAAPLPRQLEARAEPGAGRRPPSARAFWTFVVAAVVLAGALRLPLATKSLWWDETWTLQRVVLGKWEAADEGSPENLEWKDREWKRTFFYYQKPTNHIPFSVAAKATTHVWQWLSGQRHDEFSELAFRLPAFLAALGAIAALALLGRDLGFRRAGLAACLLLALHPWHIQYGIDGRSFSFVVLFSILCIHQLVIAMRGGRWRNWLAYAGSQFLLLWAFPYALFFSGLLVLAGFAAIAACAHDRRDRWLLAGRFFVANSLSAVGLAYMIGPLVPQLLKWTDKIHGNTMIHAQFFRELAANLLAGSPWDGTDSPAYFGIWTLDRLPPPLIWSLLALGALLALAGLLRAAWRSPPQAIILVAVALAAPLAITVAYYETHYFYTRYVIYALPPLLFFWAVAADGVGGLLAGRARAAGGVAALALLVGGLSLLWAPRIGLLLERPVSPNRDVAERLAELAGDDPQSIIAAGFNLGGRKPDSYNRHIRYLDDLDDLVRACGDARASGRTLYVFYGYESFNRVNEPEPFRYLDDRRLFVKLEDYYGIEPAFHYQLFRYTGRPLDP